MRAAPTSLLLGCLCALLACPGASSVECVRASDCAAPQQAPCSGCPALAVELCEEGACVPRRGDEVDVTANVNLDRDLAPSIASFVHVLASGSAAEGPLDCATAFEGEGLAPGVNVLSAGAKDVSGGSFHADVGLGRAPAGPLAVLILARDGAGGAGALVARGCTAGLEASPPALDVELVDVRAP